MTILIVIFCVLFTGCCVMCIVSKDPNTRKTFGIIGLGVFIALLMVMLNAKSGGSNASSGSIFYFNDSVRLCG